MITLTPLPPLPVQMVLPLPALPAVVPRGIAMRVHSEEAITPKAVVAVRPDSTIRDYTREEVEAASRKPVRRIFIEGEEMTDLYPMRVPPCKERPGFYHVEFGKKAEPERVWWDGKGWPALLGRFDAKGWRGKPQP